MKAVVALSGGLDSLVVLAEALRIKRHVFPVAIFYGQRNYEELDLAKEQVLYYKQQMRHQIEELHKVSLLEIFGHTALTGNGSGKSYMVPLRNLVFLSALGAYALRVGAEEVWTGLLGEAGGSTYGDFAADAHAGFVKKMQAVIDECGGGVKVKAPLIAMNKARVVERGLNLSAPIALSLSCYDPIGGKPCKECPACVDRTIGCAENGIQI